MKNLKKMALSGAFVLAVIGAFAFQAVENSHLQTVYEGTPEDCDVKLDPVCLGGPATCTIVEFSDPDCRFRIGQPSN